MEEWTATVGVSALLASLGSEHCGSYSVVILQIEKHSAQKRILNDSDVSFSHSEWQLLATYSNPKEPWNSKIPDSGTMLFDHLGP